MLGEEKKGQEIGECTMASCLYCTADMVGIPVATATGPRYDVVDGAQRHYHRGGLDVGDRLRQPGRHDFDVSVYHEPGDNPLKSGFPLYGILSLTRPVKPHSLVPHYPEPLTHPLADPLIHALARSQTTHSSTRRPTYSCTRPLANHSLIHSPTQQFVHSPVITHSLAHP